MNIIYNQETRLALLEMSIAHIHDALSEMKQDMKENNKTVREELKEVRKDIKSIKNDVSSNLKWMLGIVFGSQLFGLGVAVVGKAYGFL